MISSSVDRGTLWIDRCLSMALMKYPDRTGLGAIVGMTVCFIAERLHPALETLHFLDFNDVPRWQWLACGLTFMHLRTIVRAFRQSPIGNPQIDEQLELIERSNLSSVEKRRQYRRLIERVVGQAIETRDSHGRLSTD